MVGLDDQGLVLVGDVARQRLQTHPHLSCELFKRYMGSQREVRLGARMFRPEELSALVLRSLKEDVERFCGEPVTEQSSACRPISVMPSAKPRGWRGNWRGYASSG